MPDPLDVFVILMLGITMLIGAYKNKLQYLGFAIVFMIVYLFAINAS